LIVCAAGHRRKGNARSFRCPECYRNFTRRKARERLPKELAEQLIARGSIWLLDVYPVRYARIIARAYLALLKQKG
jgi:hypothetical protein